MIKAVKKESEEQKEDIITWKLLVSLNPLSDIKIAKYLNYEPRFNGVFSRDNLPRINDGANVINLDDKQSKGKHWVLLFISRHMAVYLDSFGIEYILQKN